MTTAIKNRTQNDSHLSSSQVETFILWIVAGPLALIASALTMAGMSTWFPEGRGGIDHLALPLVLFPAIWSLFFFYAVLESKPWRAGLVIGIIGAVNAIPVISAISSASAG